MAKATPGGESTCVVTCEVSGVPIESVVLIGPVAAGKSVGGVPTTWMAKTAGGYYEEVGQGVDRLIDGH